MPLRCYILRKPAGAVPVVMIDNKKSEEVHGKVLTLLSAYGKMAVHTVGVCRFGDIIPYYGYCTTGRFGCQDKIITNRQLSRAYQNSNTRFRRKPKERQ